MDVGKREFALLRLHPVPLKSLMCFIFINLIIVKAVHVLSCVIVCECGSSIPLHAYYHHSPNFFHIIPMQSVTEITGQNE